MDTIAIGTGIMVAVGGGAIIATGKFFLGRVIDQIDSGFAALNTRLDKINGTVQSTKDRLAEHEKEDLESFVKKEACQSIRADCPGRHVALK